MAVSNVELRVDSRQAVAALQRVNTASTQAETATQKLKSAFATAGQVQSVFSAKVANTEAAIRKQIAALREVQSNVQLGGALYQKAGKQIAEYESKLQSANRASGAAETGLSRLRNAATGLLAGFAALQAIKFVFVQAADIESQTRSLQVLTGSVQQAKQIVEELQQLGAVTPFTSSELIDAAKRLQAFGVEANKVVETTRRLADASGATGAELSGLVTAYGQVQAKGRLQGEELLQFQERGIALQEELRKMYGMTGDEFQKALSKGQVSAKAVEVALQRLTDAGGKYANGAIAQSDTLNGKLSTLQDSFQRLAQNIGTFFTPVFKFLIDGINAFLERVNSASRLQAETQAYQEASIRTRNRFGLRSSNPFDTEVQQYRARLEKSLVPAMMGAGGVKAPSAPAPVKAPALLGAAGGGTRGGGGGGGSATKAAQQIQDITKKEADLRARLALARAMEDKIAAATLTKELAIFEAMTAQIGPRQRKLDIYEAEVTYTKELRDLDQERIEKQNERLETLHEIMNSVDEIATKTRALTAAEKQQLDLAESLSTTFGQGLTGAFDALISGSDNWGKSLQDIASGVLIDIANQLLRIFVIEQAISAIKGILSPAGPSAGGYGALPGFNSIAAFRANGGSVTAGKPYMVGERGPELFMPGRSGGIAPANSFGGGVNVVVNVDATGSNVQGDQSQAKQLGGVISAAVQAELVKQKRPGGLLA